MRRIEVLLAGAALLLASWCSVHVGNGEKSSKPGPKETHTQVIARSNAEKAEMVTGDIKIAAGTLRIEGGAKELLEGEFTYNIPEWKPDVHYEGSGFRGRAVVHQGKGSASLGNDIENTWNVKLANDVPWDLQIECGAGENNFDLRSVSLRSVQMKLGAGEVVMDLRGKPEKSYDVKIEGGVGHAKVMVPSDIGVVAEAKGGLGSIDVKGLTKDGNRWVNPAYGKTKTTIQLDISGGIGQIEIIGQ